MKTQKHPDLIPVSVQFYDLDITKPDQADIWSNLQAQLLARGVKCWSTRGTSRQPDGGKLYKQTNDYLQTVKVGQPHHIETKHLFLNQYNSAAVRLFDWYDLEYTNRNMRRGYYIEPSADLEQAKLDRFTCGYCGKQQWEPVERFCRACWGSEYLKPEELHLTLLLPVAESFGADRKKLAGELPAGMVQQFTEENRVARKVAATARLDKRIKDKRRQLLQKVADGKKEVLALRWLVEQDLGHLEANLIYYSHTQNFCFGWREPYSNNEAAKLSTGALLRFPFPFTIIKRGA